MGHKSTSTVYLNNDNSGSKVTYNYNTFVKDYWTVDNPTNTYGRLNAQGPSGVSSPSRIINRSFIRLENITVGYALPKSWINHWGIQNASISASVNNVAVWSKEWEYWDPETGSYAPRTFNFALSLTL